MYCPNWHLHLILFKFFIHRHCEVWFERILCWLCICFTLSLLCSFSIFCYAYYYKITKKVIHIYFFYCYRDFFVLDGTIQPITSSRFCLDIVYRVSYKRNWISFYIYSFTAWNTRCSVIKIWNMRRSRWTVGLWIEW